jgi:rod shape-determining protein MreC
VVVHPLQWLVTAPRGLVSRVGEFFVSQATLKSENARLTEQNLANAVRLQRYDALAAENAHLRELLEARSRPEIESTTAEVLYSGRDPFSRRVVIDRGLQDKVLRGAPVIDARGVVGQVTRVYPWVSEVTLVTDKGQTVPVQNLRNGLRAVLAGRGGDGLLELMFVPLNADFQNGDKLVTSGIDGVYPPGLPVAEITQVERNAAELFARIVGRPLAGVAAHGHVLVLGWNPALPQPPAEDETPQTRRKKGRRGG